jgi:hypothetical protein
VDSGHATESASAWRRSRAMARPSAAGWVRRMPTPAFSISSAAAIPVSSETCAF